MLFPTSPLDFVEAIERERREAAQVGIKRTGLIRRLARRIAAAIRLIRPRRPRAVPSPA